MEPANKKLQHNFFLIIFIVALVVMFFVFRPFLTSLVLAFALAIVFQPIYTRILKRFNNRETIAALSTVLIVVVVVLIPLIIIGSLLFEEVKSLYTNFAASSGEAGVIAHASDVIQYYIHAIAPGSTVNLGAYIEGSLAWALSHLNAIFAAFLNVFLVIVVMIIALFYILRDGAKLKRQYMNLSPLSDSYDENILNRLKSAIESVMRGSLIIAVVQGTLAGIGTSLAGLPNPVIWGLMAMVASLIPALGTGLVMVPAIIYLFVTKQYVDGAILLVWQSLVVGLVDNFLTPHLLRRGMKLHPFLILLSVLGGVTFFGPIGFILGPIVLALLFSLLEIYPLIMKSE
jgi:predicted PurR-regulated permease PerM